MPKSTVSKLIKEGTVLRQLWMLQQAKKPSLGKLEREDNGFDCDAVAKVTPTAATCSIQFLATVFRRGWLQQHTSRCPKYAHGRIFH